MFCIYKQDIYPGHTRHDKDAGVSLGVSVHIHTSDISRLVSIGFFIPALDKTVGEPCNSKNSKSKRPTDQDAGEADVQWPTLETEKARPEGWLLSVPPITRATDA